MRFGSYVSVLFTLILVLPLHAQQTSVTLSICNAGKVAFDAFVVVNGEVRSKHVRPATCEQPYRERTAVPAYVGFALEDSKGQWDAVRRIDFVPALGTNTDVDPSTMPTTLRGILQPNRPPTPHVPVMERATESFPVRHGSADVMLPMQFRFRPSRPVCHVSQPSTSASRLPLGATIQQQREAARIDEAINSNAVPTTCDQFVYAVNLAAYPEMREMSVEKGCEGCAGHLNPHSPSQPVSIEEASTAEPAQFISWRDLLTAMNKHGRNPGRAPGIPKYIIVRGTVSGVDVAASGYEPGVSWVNIFFKESPTAARGDGMVVPNFNVCSSDPGIFQQMFGPDFRSTMTGKAIEVQGEFPGGGNCKAWQGSLRITLARQIHPIASVTDADVHAAALHDQPLIGKKACNIFNQSDLETTFGKKLYSGPNVTVISDTHCLYRAWDGKSDPPDSFFFYVDTTFNPRANPDAVIQFLNQLKKNNVVPQPVEGFGDAAFWLTGSTGASELDVFSGGTDRLSLGGMIPLSTAETLAKIALGGQSGKTGYVYRSGN